MSLEPSISKGKLFGVGVRWLLGGALVCVFSLNGILRFVANWWPNTRTNSILGSIASIPDSLYRSLPGGPYFLFEMLFHWVFILLGAYVLLLLIASVRYQSPVIVVSGMSGLLIGLFALTWLSLLILLLVLVLGLFRLIIDLLSYLFSAIISFFLWTPVFYTLVTLVSIAAVAIVIALVKSISFRDLWDAFKEWVRNLSARPLVFLLVLLAAGALIWFVGIPLWEYYISPILLAIRNWLAEYVAPILAWIGALLLTIIGAIIVFCLVLLTLALLGWQFADQFKSARSCGGDTHQTFRAGFGMGAVMGLVFLVCAANPTYRSLVATAWSETSPILASMDLSGAIYYFMPARVEIMLHAGVAAASLPIFDLACLLLALLLANSSLITGLLSRVTIKPLRGLVEANSLPPLGLALFGVVFGLVLVVLDSFGNENA